MVDPALSGYGMRLKRFKLEHFFNVCITSITLQCGHILLPSQRPLLGSFLASAGFYLLQVSTGVPPLGYQKEVTEQTPSLPYASGREGGETEPFCCTDP